MEFMWFKKYDAPRWVRFSFASRGTFPVISRNNLKYKQHKYRNVYSELITQ